MPATKRLMALLLSVVAFALTVTGVVIAATDSNPGTVLNDPLALHGYPPTSANLLVNVSTGASFGLSANVWVNFSANRVDAIIQFPLIVSTAAVEVRLLDNRLYARPADVTSGPWFAMKLKTPSLFGVSLELTKPDIQLISGFSRETVTKSGYTTTYTFYRAQVAMTSFLGSTTSRVGSVRWSITVGSEGEAVSSVLRLHSGSRTTTVSATVVSYNHPVSIATPVAANVKPIASSALRQLLRSLSFSTLLVPQNFTSLSQVHLS